MHDSTEGVATVQIGSTSAKNFDTGNSFAGNTIPIDPASEGIDEGKTVFENQGAAGGGASETSERDALVGGIRGATAGAAEERESRDLTEHVIDAERRVGDDIFFGEQDCTAGSIRQPSPGTGCGDRDPFAGRSGFEHDVNDSMGGGGSPGALGGSESRRANFDRPKLRGYGPKREVSTAVGNALGVIRTGLQSYRGVGNDRCSRVANGALHDNGLR